MADTASPKIIKDLDLTDRDTGHLLLRTKKLASIIDKNLGIVDGFDGAASQGASRFIILTDKGRLCKMDVTLVGL
jgi:hypothetical protein